jgi:hypothetical protein
MEKGLLAGTNMPEPAFDGSHLTCTGVDGRQEKGKGEGDFSLSSPRYDTREIK